MKIAYIILHYMAGKDTIECADSILESTKNSKYETNIVIVDNGSPNSSYAEIQRVFESEKKITLLQINKNLGFAKGNNIGFLYAKNKLKANFIILLNNDTLIQQHDFNEKIVEKYLQYNYGVLGPDIVTLDSCHQNPIKDVNWSMAKLVFFRLKKRIQYMLAHFEFFDCYLTLNEGSFSKEKLGEDKLNVQLHGACLIFSQEYINKFDGLYDKTFLYMEEDILKLRSEYFGYLMVYTPELKIIHKEDIATNMVTIKSIEKKKRVYYNLIKSSKVYMRLMRMYTYEQRLRKMIELMAQRFKSQEFKLDKQIPITYLVRLGFERFWMLLRGYLKQSFKTKYKIFCGKKVILRCKSKMHFQNNVTLQNKVYIDALSTDGVYLGKGSSLGSGTVVRCTGNLNSIGKGFYLGENSSLADNCFIGATGGVWIGDNVIGGQNIRFHSSNHNFNDINTLIRKQGINARGIRIGDNCWIGAGVVFCDGVKVGDGCVIGANSVVTKEFPDGSIIAGVPAKIIGTR